MTTLTDQISLRCTEAREAINTAWSVRDLAKAALLVSQVEFLALMGAGTVQLPDKAPGPSTDKAPATDPA